LIFNDVDIIGRFYIPIGRKAEFWSAIGRELLSDVADFRR